MWASEGAEDFERLTEVLGTLPEPRRILSIPCAAGKEVLARNPAFTVQSWTLAAPYKNEADLERELDGLRKAGLPE